MLGVRTRGLDLVLVVYVAIGIVLAWNRDYFASLDTIERVGSAILAVLLWPLLLLGIDLHVHT